MAISKNKYFFLMLLASLISGNLTAQDPTNDLEEVNVYDSLNSNQGAECPN